MIRINIARNVTPIINVIDWLVLSPEHTYVYYAYMRFRGWHIGQVHYVEKWWYALNNTSTSVVKNLSGISLAGQQVLIKW